MGSTHTPNTQTVKDLASYMASKVKIDKRAYMDFLKNYRQQHQPVQRRKPNALVTEASSAQNRQEYELGLGDSKREHELYEKSIESGGKDWSRRWDHAQQTANMERSGKRRKKTKVDSEWLQLQ